MTADQQLDLPAEVTLRVATRSDWHVGSGAGHSGGVNTLIRRDSRGLPYLPGTTVTGVYREACLQVAAGLDGLDATSPDGTDRGGPSAAESWTRWVGHLFGARAADNPAAQPSHALVRIRAGHASPALRSRLASSLQLQAATTFVKPGVSIDHETGRARDRTVWSVEMARAGLNLYAPMELDDALTGEHRTAASVLLVLGATWLRALGGNRRRGAGEVSVELCYPDAPEWSRLVSDCADWATAHQPPPPTEVIMPGSALIIKGTGRSQTQEDPWVELSLAITAVEALRVPRATIGNVIHGHPHIPGTTLLAWVLSRLDSPFELRQALASGAAVVTNAVPEIDGSPGRPAPAVLREPKPADGRLRNSFQPGTFDRPADPLWDAWVPDTADGTSPVHVAEPVEAFVTHNVVTVLSGRPTTDDGGVFTVQVIPAGTRLHGTIRLRMSVANALDERRRDWHEALTGQGRLGSARKSEYGQVAVTATRPHPVPDAKVTLHDGGTVTIWALSDILVRDARLRLNAGVDDVVTALAARLGVELELVDCAVRGARTESWQGSWRLPRPSMVGLAAGSCLKLRVIGHLDPARLTDVIAGGLGSRTGEGYGQLAIGAALLDQQDLTVVRPVSDNTCDDRRLPGAAPSGDLDGPDRAYFSVIERVAFRDELARYLHASLNKGPDGTEHDGYARQLADARTQLDRALRALSPSQRGGFRELVAGLATPEGLNRLRAVVERPNQRRYLTDTVKALAGLMSEKKLAFLLVPARDRLGLTKTPDGSWVDAFGLLVTDVLDSIEADDRTSSTTEAADARLYGRRLAVAIPSTGASRRSKRVGAWKVAPVTVMPEPSRRRYRSVCTRWELTATMIAQTPLHVGGAYDDVYLDLKVALDGRDRPYIPGSSLAGVLRSWWHDHFGEPDMEAVWDGQARRKDPHDETDEFLASLIEVSDAPLEGSGGEPPTLGHRDGVGIDRWTGAAAYRIKYERQVVPAGTRLRLRLVAEDVAPGGDLGRQLEALKNALIAYGLSVGAASTRGLGRLAVVSGTAGLRSFAVNTRQGVLAAIRHAVTPEAELSPADDEVTPAALTSSPAPGVLRFEMTWRPDGPLLVGAALPGEHAALMPLLDAHPDTGLPVPVLPGSSVKGVLSAEVERALCTCFDSATSDNTTKSVRPSFNANRADMANRFPAFERLFGSQNRRGALSIPDTYANPPASTWKEWDDFRNGNCAEPPGDGWARVATHVAIDRWTGGAADGLLFTVLEPHRLPWEPLRFDLDLRRLSAEPRHRIAEVVLLLYALSSLAAGTVPLGRGGNRGLGAIEVREIRIHQGNDLLTFPQSWAGDVLSSAGTALERRKAVLALARDLCVAGGIHPERWTDHLEVVTA